MGKKANAFFFLRSHFLFLSFFLHDFHRKIISFVARYSLGESPAYFLKVQLK
jgi:hypothetical protein